MRYVVLSIVIAIFLSASVYWGYLFFTGEDRKLYDVAEIEYNNGNFRKSHDMLVKVLEINNKNRKALSLKTKTNFIIINEDLVSDAKRFYDDALAAIDRREFNRANEYFDNALEKLYNVSPSFSGYEEAMRFEKTVINKVNEVLENAPKMYLNKAKVEMARGDYEKAYDTLTYILKPSSEVEVLKSDLAYTIGRNQYEDIVKRNLVDSFYINDTIYWLEKVNEKSAKYESIKVEIAELKDRLKVSR